MKKRIALLLAGATLASAILAGCSGATKDGSTDGSGNAGAGMSDQELTLNLGEEPPSLDSARAEDEISFDVLGQVMDGLLRQGENAQLLPGIAEKWEISPDGKVYTFNLRKDAKWSDGQPVTSKDFKFAWLRALDPNVASTYGYQLYYIKGGEAFNTLDVKAADFKAKYDELKANVAIETPDDYTLKVTLENPTPYFLSLMTFSTYLPQREDIVAAAGEQFATAPDKMVYNGPFVIDEWVHEDSIVLKKNANYWDAKAVKLETVTFKMVKDTNTAVQMYEAGELDWTGLNGEFIPRYKDQGIKTIAQPTTWYLTMNMQSPITGNKNIRKAINVALDRKAFVENVLKNGSISAEGLVPPTITGLNGQSFRSLSGSLTPQAVNKDEAKKLFEAGLKELGTSKITLKMLTSDSSNGKRYAQGIQEMLQTTLPGLTVEIEPVSFKVRLERQKAGQFDLAYAGWGADFLDPMTFMNMWVSTSAQNDAKWSNKAYDELVKAAETNGDQNVRMKAMAEAEKILLEELPIIPLYNPTANRILRPYVKGVVFLVLGPSLDLKGAYIEGKE